jgi:hypothetical protein
MFGILTRGALVNLLRAELQTTLPPLSRYEAFSRVNILNIIPGTDLEVLESTDQNSTILQSGL